MAGHPLLKQRVKSWKVEQWSLSMKRGTAPRKTASPTLFLAVSLTHTPPLSLALSVIHTNILYIQTCTHAHTLMCFSISVSWLIWSTLHQYTGCQCTLCWLPRAISRGAPPALDYQQLDASRREPYSLLTYSYVFTLKASALVFMGGWHQSWRKNNIWREMRGGGGLTDRHIMPTERCLRGQSDWSGLYCGRNKVGAVFVKIHKWEKSESVDTESEIHTTPGSIINCSLLVAVVDLCICCCGFRRARSNNSLVAPELLSRRNVSCGWYCYVSFGAFLCAAYPHMNARAWIIKLYFQNLI